MGSEVSVAPATPAQLPAIAQLEAETFGPSAWSRADVLAAPRAPGALCLCAQTPAGEVAGYLFATLVADDLHINTLAVRPTCRRQGVGAALVKALLARGRAAGGTLCTLEVRGSNRGAVALYRRLGFAAAGRRPRFYRHPAEDALLLQRRLSPEETEGDRETDAGIGN